MLHVFLILTLITGALPRWSEDEVRVVDTVIDAYVATAQTTLAVAPRSIRPLLRGDARLLSLRNARTPLYLAYARLRSGRTFGWLRDRGDLWITSDRPELALSAPAIAGGEALVYGQSCGEGRLFHLRKFGDQWEITWSAVLTTTPDCS
ncbi:MAG: hypothetical protein M3Q69_07050 [Acidobacteriota bacterium]|nr:hypothetical protein [Acidobacteriota bacterium]